MDSGQWHVEKRSTLRNESFLKEYGPVSETGSLSIVVLGASGDLAKKKTFPALFNLYHQVLNYLFHMPTHCSFVSSPNLCLIVSLVTLTQGFLNPDEVHIFGYARSKISDQELRDKIHGLDLHFCIFFLSCLL